MDSEEDFIKLPNIKEDIDLILSQKQIEYINRGYQEHEPIFLQIK